MKLTVEEHDAIRREMLAGLLHERDHDDIDAELDEMIEVDPANFNPPSRRKDSELARMLDLLDNLPRGEDSH